MACSNCAAETDPVRRFTTPFGFHSTSHDIVHPGRFQLTIFLQSAEDDAKPPGTSFADLPEHWACPGCEAARERFLVLDDGSD
jgi:rubredoxin